MLMITVMIGKRHSVKGVCMCMDSEVKHPERDRTEAISDFAEGLQNLVNNALNVLSAVEIVGVLEVLKSEVLIEGNKQRFIDKCHQI